MAKAPMVATAMRKFQIFKAVIYMCLPLISFYTVEFLNGNLLTEDLKAYQIALNLIWYYIVYILVLVACRRYAVSVIIAGFIFIFIGIVIDKRI